MLTVKLIESITNVGLRGIESILNNSDGSGCRVLLHFEKKLDSANGQLDAGAANAAPFPFIQSNANALNQHFIGQEFHSDFLFLFSGFKFQHSILMLKFQRKNLERL
jgi:hypothetical protein